MARVLFVCTGNTCRSPMAERLARLHFPQHRWESAGAAAEAALNPLAAAVLAERGADSSGFEPRPVQDLDLRAYDAVVLIGARAQRLSLPEGPARHEWDVADPLDVIGTEAERLEAYRRTADELLRRIRELAQGL